MAPRFNGRLDTPTLRTAMYEAIAAMNSRPITTPSFNDPQEGIITPNQLITMKPHPVSPPPGIFANNEIYGRKMWRKVQQFAEDFWKEWKSSYLSDITRRQRWESK